MGNTAGEGDAPAGLTAPAAPGRLGPPVPDGVLTGPAGMTGSPEPAEVCQVPGLMT